jgi:CHAT domain-containing protein
VSSYTPTLAALSRAQKGARTFESAQSKLLLVSAQQVGLPRLAKVQVEMDIVAAIARNQGIECHSEYASGSAKSSQVVEQLQDTDFVHIACHGTQNPTNALASGFCMSDGMLTVSQLMKIDHRTAFFAFLSACETAKGDKRQADQTVHLAATMLFAGFRSVVATMW